MSQFVGSLIEELAQIAGVELTDDQKNVFKGKEFAGQVPDEIFTGLKSKLIGRESVLHDPEIKKTMWGSAFGTFDTRLKQFAKTDLGLSEDEVKAIRGSTDRSALDVFPDFLKKAKELGKKEAEANSGLNIDEIRKKVVHETEAQYKDRLEKNIQTINKLQSEMEQLTHREQSLKSEWESKFDSFRIKNSLSQKINSLSWRSDFGEAVNDLKQIAVQKLADKFVWKEEAGQLLPYSKEDPALRATKDGKMLNADDVIMPEVANYLNKSGSNGSDKKVIAPGQNGNSHSQKVHIVPRPKF